MLLDLKSVYGEKACSLVQGGNWGDYEETFTKP